MGDLFDPDDFNTRFEAQAQALVKREAGQPSFEPLDAQRQIARLLAEHKRVIAVQPTGSGKTLAAALPFVANVLDPLYPERQPAQMVFMTPMRSLTSAQADTLTKSFYSERLAERFGLTRREAWDWVRQQTGTVPDDPDFEAVATVATFDQALSSALRISYSASARRRTVNAGAILGSYLVADELHLFPRGEALTTLLCLLKHRPPELPFLLMTATLTPTVAHTLGNLLGAQVYDAPLSMRDLATLGVAGRERTVRWQPEPLTARQIARTLQDCPEDRILVVVNTVQRAIDLARELETLIGRERLTVLHSRFYQNHRQQHQSRVMEAFAKHGERGGETRVAVATQVVEVGLDISADRIFTELAPASALVQRWGRSARWGGKAEIVVAPPSSDPGARVYPYTGQEEAAVIAKTRAWLEEHAGGAGVLMNTEQEHGLVEYAHREADEQWARQLESTLTARATQIGQAIAEGRYELAGSLIRHVDSRTVLIYGTPEDEELKEPHRLEGFSLAPGSLMSLLPETERRDRAGRTIEDDDEGEGSIISLDLPAEIRWALRYPVWSRDLEGSEARANIVHHWEDATRRVDITAQPVLVVHPSLVSYDEFFGLSLKAGQEPVPEALWAPSVDSKRPAWHPTPRVSETYAQHIERMLALYERHPALGPRLKRVAPTVEAWLGWPEGMLDTLTRAAIVAHDAGKLSPKWQEGIRAYQSAIGRPMQLWLVHTDDPGGMPEPRWKPPHHALSGAAHSLEVGAALDRLAFGDQAERKAPLPSNVLFTAITTHHTPHVALDNLWLSTEELLDVPAIAELSQLIAQWGVPGQASAPGTRDLAPRRKVVDQLNITSSKNSREAFALALVIRMLRLADGWSQDPVRRKEANAN